MEAKPIALSFHPTKPLFFLSQDNNKIAYFNMETFCIDRYIQAQREPDVSRWVAYADV